MKDIILASASPRRKELLEQVGLRFKIMPSEKEEIITKLLPQEIVEDLSLQKALNIAEKLTKNYAPKKVTYVLGADTIVVFEGKVLGKPKDQEDAFRMLTMLQGNIHQVYTGVTMVTISENTKEMKTFHEVTHVEILAMNNDEIKAYIETKEPMDKAGAYGIQGQYAVYIKGITGDYNNVVGLPISRIFRECRELFS